MLFSLFWRGFFSRFFTYFCPHISYTIFVSCTSTVQYHIQVSGSAWSVAKQDGDAACSATQCSWNLGTVWDGLGRLGAAWKAWDGFGKLVGPCRNQSKWKTLKTVQGTRCYCSVIVDGFIEHRQTIKQGWTGTINKPATNLSARWASFECSAPSGQFHLPR